MQKVSFVNVGMNLFLPALTDVTEEVVFMQLANQLMFFTQSNIGKKFHNLRYVVFLLLNLI